MTKVNPFPKKNNPAYLTVMISMFAVSLLLWFFYFIIRTGTFKTSYFSEYSTELIFAVLMVMSGMMIMFIAFLLNLRKMKKGCEKMASGVTNVKIPEVWCPVLTSAIKAAEHFVYKTVSTNEK